jgi:hypothetical protein
VFIKKNIALNDYVIFAVEQLLQGLK